MPWRPLRRIAFAVAVFPFQASSAADLPLELGDELYIIEQGGAGGLWYRGYLVSPPSLLAGLTSVKGQPLEARVFSGIFPKSCVEVRELLGEGRAEVKRPAESIAEEDGESVRRESHLRRSGSFKIANRITNGERFRDTSHSGDHEASSDSHSRRRKSKSHKSKLSGEQRPNRVDSLTSPKRSISHRKVENVLTGQGHNSLLSQLSTPSLVNLSEARHHGSDAQKPPAPVPMLKVGDETPTSVEEPLVDEIASCLREWHSTNLHELLLTQKYSRVDRLIQAVKELDFARRQLLHSVLTRSELRHLRQKVVWDLVKVNKILSGDIVVRDPARRGRILTSEDSAMDISQLQSIMSLLDETPSQQQDQSPLHHLLLRVKPLERPAREPLSIEFSLYSKELNSPPRSISESFIMDGYGSEELSKSQNKLQTLFANLSSADVGQAPEDKIELFLVAKVRKEKAFQAAAGADQPSATAPRSPGTVKKPPPTPTSSSPGAAAKGGRRSLMWSQKGRGLQATGSEDMLQTNSENATGTTNPIQSSPTLTSESIRTQSTSTKYKQLIGLGVLRVDRLLLSDNETVRSLAIWCPSKQQETNHEQNGGWNDVIKDIFDGQVSNFSKPTALEQVTVALHSFVKPDADKMIAETPTLLQDVPQTKKIGFSGAPTKPRSDIYISLSKVVLPRQALLSHPKLGSIAIPAAFSSFNLHVKLEVRNAQGEAIPGCIYPASNQPGVTRWESSIVDKQSSWGSTIRLAIPPEDVPSCHLVALLSEAPTSPFAIAWIPLWDQQAFIKDGPHSLLLYRLDDSTSFASDPQSGKGGYLSCPWNSRGKDDTSKDEAVTGPLSTLRLETYLSSTAFSQDRVLLGLLKWREQLPGDLMEILKRVVFVPEIEIVKLLGSVFDSLFGILVEQAGNDDYEDLVFSALVTVLGIVHDRRFNVAPLVDHYSETDFKYPFATPCLIRSFTRLLSNPAGMESSRKLRATFKVGRHILKFIIHAREQQKAKEAGIGITSTQPSFSRELQSIFRALEALMRNPVATLVGSQTLAVQHFHTWIPELTGYLESKDIIRIAIGFMESCSEVRGKLILYRLVLLINYSHLKVFAQGDARQTLVNNTIRWLDPLWGDNENVTDQWKDQVRLCCSVLSSQMQSLEDSVAAYLPKLIKSYQAIQATEQTEKATLSLLFPNSYPFPTRVLPKPARFDEALSELAAVLGALCSLPRPATVHYPELEVSHFIQESLHVYKSILNCDAFPSNWTSVHMYHHRATMKTLDGLGRILTESFIPEPEDAENFDTDLWQVFFTTLFKLVGSDALTLENFPEQKRRAAWQIAGDVREQGAALIRRAWDAIGWEATPDDQQQYGLDRMGGFQVQYVPSLVPNIVELCLSVHGGLRSVAVEVLQSMIISEWTLNQDLSVIQAEMIDSLDHLFKAKNLNESILQNSFTTELSNLFEPLSHHPDDPLFESLQMLLERIDEFLDLLVAAHTSDMSGEALTIMHTLRLMEFLRDMQKIDIFIRYVHKLAQLQVRSKHYAEAGLALRFHADLYDWNPTEILDEIDDPSYPQQSAFERKEALFFDMIRHFEEAESYSMALAAYRELSEQYEHNVFDFVKLARTQRAMAKVHEAIAKGQRQAPRYFRVLYQGMGFPTGVRDRQFIFEGLPSEKLSGFVDRMQEQYPSAKLAPSGEIEDVEGQFLQITQVSTQRDLQHPVYRRSKIQQSIREYLLFSHPSQFTMTAQRSPNGVGVQEQWVTKTVYTTNDSFPTILKRSEIASTSEIRLNATQSGIERTTRKTQELAAIERRVSEGKDSEIPSFVETIRASVDPESELSVSRYRELLSAEEEAIGEETIQDSDNDPLEEALRIALMDHVLVLRRCLSLCAKLESHHSIPHADLHGNFNSTYAPEIATLASSRSKQLSTEETDIDKDGTPVLPASFSFSQGGEDSVRLSSDPPAISTISPTEPARSNDARRTRHEKNRLSLNFLKRPQVSQTGQEAMNGTQTSLEQETSQKSSRKNEPQTPVGVQQSPALTSSSFQGQGTHTAARSGSLSDITHAFQRRRGSSASQAAAATPATTVHAHPPSQKTPSQSRSHARSQTGDASPAPPASAGKGSTTPAAKPRMTNTDGISSRGSVKKRFSMLKMGKREKERERIDHTIASVREE